MENVNLDAITPFMDIAPEISIYKSKKNQSLVEADFVI